MIMNRAAAWWKHNVLKKSILCIVQVPVLFWQHSPSEVVKFVNIFIVWITTGISENL